MKRKAVQTFRIWSIFLVLAGILSAGLAVFQVTLLFRDPQTSRFLAVVATLLMLSYAVLEIVAGAKSVSFSAAVFAERRVRAANAKVLSYRRMALAGIFLCLVRVILSCFIGTVLWQLLVMILFGIFFPLFYLIASRSLV